MALQKQPIAVQLGQGIDTKTDKKHVLPGKLLLLENAVFKKRNRLDKRNGYRKLSSKTIDGETLPSGSALETFNDELLQYANGTLYSYSDGPDRWVPKGSAVSAIVRTRQVVKNTEAQTQADSAYLSGVAVYAWEDSRGGVRANVIDETSGASLISDVELAASGSRVRCLAFGSYLYVFYVNSGSLYLRRINPLEATEFEAAVEITDDISLTVPNYDVHPYQTLRILFAYTNESGDDIVAGWLDEDGAVLTGALAEITIAEEATDCLGIIPGPSNTFYLAWHNATGMRVAVYNNGLGELAAPLTIESPATDAVNVTGYALSDGSGVRLFYEVTGAKTYEQYIRQADVELDGTIAAAASDFLRSVGLISKAWTYTDADGNQNSYVGVVHESTLQATYFVARHDALIVAKQQYSLASGLTSVAILGNVWSASDGVYAYAILNKTQLISENATIFTPTGVAKTSLDFTSQDVFTAAQLGNNLHIVGGVLQMYDGQSVVEHGFHLYPENVTCTPATSGGSLADGSYQVIVLYEWTDNFGQLHRSAPSVAETVSVSGGGGSGSIAVVAPSLRLTAKKGSRTDVSIVGYVSEMNGTDVWYRWTSVSAPTMNVPTADTVTLPTITAVSPSNEILYSTGGVLEHFAPPASSAILVYKNRIVLAGLEEANDVWFSKEAKSGEAVAFSDEIKKSVEPGGGGVTALAKIDDKLLLIKKSTYYYTYGDGPNNTGQFGEFAEPTQVPQADVGTDNSQSISAVPDGVMMKTTKGLYLINSSLTPLYIGAEVEDYNALSVTSAALVADVNQVRFTTSDGVGLVYDYYFRQWSTFTAHEAKDAVVWQGTYVMLKTNGDVWIEEAGTFKDAGAPIRVRIGTGWLALAGVTGFQRVYRVALLGEYKSPHKLRTFVGYDYSPAYSDSIPFDPDTSLEIARFGDGATFGADATFGGSNNAYRFSAGLRIQKCQAIRFLIEEETTSATAGSQEAFNITTLGLLVGVKAGLGKFKARQNIGTE